MRKLIHQFLRDESGATAIEYGLIAALISVAIITAVTAVGTTLTTTFNPVAPSLGSTVSLRTPPRLGGGVLLLCAR